MKKKQEIQQNNADVDMTPMLDIVFILLIFFIVTTSFVKPVAIELQRPLDKPSIDKPTKNAHFNIDKSNVVHFAGREIEIGNIASNLAMFAAKYSIKHVQISASKDSKHQTLVSVMNNIKEYNDYPISLISD